MKESGSSNNKMSYFFKVFLIAGLAVSAFMILIYHKIDAKHAVEKADVVYLKDWTVIDSSGNSFEAEEGYQDDDITDDDL